MIEHDFAHNKAQNALTIGCRRADGVPDPRQVLTQGL